MKRRRSIIMAGALVLFFTGAFLLGNIYAQYRTEKEVMAASEDEYPDAEEGFDDNLENAGMEEETVPEEAGFVWLTEEAEQERAEREKAKRKGEELVRQAAEAEQKAQIEISEQLAEHILKTMADAPLLQEYAKENYGESSLENNINDVNVAKSAKAAIIRVCEEAGIDVKTAKVRDLTKEQIVQIDQEVYSKSEHPMN